MSLGVIGKLFGLELPEVMMPEEFTLEDRSVLEAMADQKPTIPIGVFNVEGGGLHEGEIVATANRIQANTLKMRAQMLRIQTEFHRMNLPQSYAIFMLDYQLRAAKVNAERSLVTRFHRSQGSGRNWGTPHNSYPIDIAYLREVALARNHIHTNTMIATIAAKLGPPAPAGASVGFVLPLTPQERAVSEQAAAEHFLETRGPVVGRLAIRNRTTGYAVYPHEASATNPALSKTYLDLVAYAEVQYQKALDATRKPSADPKATQAAAAEWGNFMQSLQAKWGRQGASPLYAKDAEAQKARGPSPEQIWMKAYNEAVEEWKRLHPEVVGELAHAETLILPHQRWMNWFSGQPFTTPGSDGTNLDYLIAIEAGKPVASQQACIGARAANVVKARQTGKPIPSYTAPSFKPC